MEPVLGRVVHLIAAQFAVAPDDLRPTTHLVEELAGDSLDAIELQLALEQTFRIQIPDDRWLQVETVKDATEAVAGLVEPAPEAGRSANTRL